MKILTIYDPKNSFMRRDGDEFEKQAEICRKYYESKGDECWSIPVRGKNAFQKRQSLFFDLRADAGYGLKYDRIIFFMHGEKRNLNRRMISMSNIVKFADRLKYVAAKDCKIVLFSCWAGEFRDGFAAKLSRLTGLDVVAHTTRGHTTRNPYKVVYHQCDEIECGFECGYGVFSDKLWREYGGIRELKKRLSKSKTAPFEFVEGVFE